MCLPLTVRYEAILQTQTIHLDHVPPPLVIVRVTPQAMILHNSDLQIVFKMLLKVMNTVAKAAKSICHGFGPSFRETRTDYFHYSSENIVVPRVQKYFL